MEKNDNMTAASHKPGAKDSPPDTPVTYTISGRVFIVRPIFKDEAPRTISTALLRLMRADCEAS